MVCTSWRTMAAVLWALAGLAGFQTTPVHADDPLVGQFMSVKENGKVLLWRIVTTWPMPDGGRGFRVQNVGNGEYMTMVYENQNGDPAKGGTMSVRLWHWNKSNVSPAGRPSLRWRRRTVPPVVGIKAAARAPGSTAGQPSTNLTPGGKPAVGGPAAIPPPVQELPMTPAEVDPRLPMATLPNAPPLPSVPPTYPAMPPAPPPLPTNVGPQAPAPFPIAPPPLPPPGGLSAVPAPPSVPSTPFPKDRTTSQDLAAPSQLPTSPAPTSTNVFGPNQSAAPPQLPPSPPAPPQLPPSPPASSQPTSPLTPFPVVPPAAAAQPLYPPSPPASNGPTSSGANPNPTPAVSPSNPGSGKDSVAAWLQRLLKNDPPPARPASTTGLGNPAPFPIAPSQASTAPSGSPQYLPNVNTASPAGPAPKVPYSTALYNNLSNAPPPPPPTAQPPYVAPANGGQPSSVAGALPPSNDYKNTSGLPSPPADRLPVAIRERKYDPLEHPETLNPPERPLAKPPELAVKKDPPAQDAPGPSTTTMPGSRVQQTAYLPPGSASVFAANMATPRYIPVPTVTIPPTTQAQGPPPPQIPEPPPAAPFVNAFSQQRNPAAEAPSYTREQLMQPAMLAEIYATNPYLSNPALLQRDRQYFPQLPGPQQALIQQALYIQQQMIQQPPRPFAQVNYPANYQGPLPPPNPFANQQSSWGVVQAQYQPPAYPYYPQYRPYPQYGPNYAWPYQQQGQNSQQAMRLLTESINPAQREWAVAALGCSDWRSDPRIVPTLLQFARTDPAATVRAGCVNILSRGHMTGDSFVSTLRALQSDPDVRVRQEAEEALRRLGSR